MITVKQAYEILKKEYPGKEVLLNTISEYDDCFAITDMVSKKENEECMTSNWWPGFPEIAIMKKDGLLLSRFDKNDPGIENEKEWDEISELTDDTKFIKSYSTVNL